MKKRIVDWTNECGDIITAILYDDIPLTDSNVEDHLHIQDLKWEETEVRGRYYLNIGRYEYQSDDLDMLECLLREFAESDGRSRADLPEDMATTYALNDGGNPAHIEIVEGGGRIRVEQTFYALTETNHTIDGPFDNKQDAIDTVRHIVIKEAKEIKQ